MRKLIPFILLFSIFSLVKGQDLDHIKIDSINSSYDEFNPVLSPDGNTLYVTKRGHAANIAGVIDQGDIWFATKTSSGWTKLQHAGNVINHQGLNGVVGFSVDGSRMYLLNYFETSEDGGGNLRQGISVSTKVNGAWSLPEKLGIQFFQNKSSHVSASISRDEKILIISMTSFTTEGNEDLYVSLKQANGEWSQPLNLGATINTYAEEWSPFLAADNKTLYFSSNGFEGGYGSRDIYVSKRLGDSWTEWSQPINLGEGINTEGVELGFFIPNDGNEALFSTTQNSEGMGDIFAYALNSDQKTAPEDLVVEEPMAVMEDKQQAQEVIDVPEEKPEMAAINFQVIDAQTGGAIDAQIELVYKGGLSAFSTSESKDGQSFEQSFELDAVVQVNVSADGYLDFKTELIVKNTAEESGVSTEVFALTKREVGTAIVIDNVLFKQGTDSFSNAETAEAELDKLIVLMTSNPDLRIRLEGHTDNRGDARILKTLSEDRVETVRYYMVSKGIDESRIEIMGYGGTKPLSRDNSSASRKMDRRVEFVIIN